MLSDLTYSVNGVLPVFITALVGFFLEKFGLITDGFVSCADKLVFRVMLPCMLFLQVANTQKELIGADDLKLAAFCLVGIIAVTVIMCAAVPRFVRQKASCGAFIQGVFRSNMAFLGVPFALNLFGEEGGRLAAMLLACVVPLYNVLAVTYSTVREKPIKAL